MLNKISLIVVVLVSFVFIGCEDDKPKKPKVKTSAELINSHRNIDFCSVDLKLSDFVDLLGSELELKDLGYENVEFSYKNKVTFKYTVEYTKNYKDSSINKCIKFDDTNNFLSVIKKRFEDSTKLPSKYINVLLRNDNNLFSYMKPTKKVISHIIKDKVSYEKFKDKILKLENLPEDAKKLFEKALFKEQRKKFIDYANSEGIEFAVSETPNLACKLQIHAINVHFTTQYGRTYEERSGYKGNTDYFGYNPKFFADLKEGGSEPCQEVIDIFLNVFKKYEGKSFTFMSGRLDGLVVNPYLYKKLEEAGVPYKTMQHFSKYQY